MLNRDQGTVLPNNLGAPMGIPSSSAAKHPRTLSDSGAAFVQSLWKALREDRCPLPESLISTDSDPMDLTRRISEYFGLSLEETLPPLSLHSPTQEQPPPTLAELLERRSLPDHPHLSGSFYTSQAIAETITARVVAAFQERHARPPSSALDPACGSGVFTSAMVKTLASCGMDPTQALLAVHGWDIQNNAAESARIGAAICHLQLLARAPEMLPSLCAHYCCRDSLCGEAGLGSLFPPASPDGFELIVGNPPFGLAREGRIDPLSLAVLSQRYRHIRSGKLNKYLLFVARSLELLAPRGMLSLIVPNSWLGIESGRGLRRYLLSNCSHIVLDRFLTPLFPSLGVETIVLTLAKGGSTDRYLVRTFSEPLDTTPLKQQWYQLSSHDTAAPWPISGSARQHDWLRDIEARSMPLGTFARCYVGLQAYARGKGSPAQSAEVVRSHPFHSNRPFSEHSIPYLRGKDVQRYAICWSGSHLRFGPWLAEYPPRSRYEGPRVIIREVLHRSPYRIQACFTSNPFVHNRSALMLLDQAHHDESLLYALCALLNSQLGSLIMTLRGRKSQRRLFPKLVQGDIENFPIAPTFSGMVLELASLSKNLHQSAGKAAAAEAEIEALLSSLYGLGRGGITSAYP